MLEHIGIALLARLHGSDRNGRVYQLTRNGRRALAKQHDDWRDFARAVHPPGVSRERIRREPFGKTEIETRYMALTQQHTEEAEGTAFDAIDWALRLGVAIAFVGIGCEKVFPWRGSYWIKLFTDIGFGLWFMYLTGTLQIIGGLLMIVPRTALFGAALLACTMVGAILTHLFLLGTGLGAAVFPAAFLALIVAAIGRRFTDRSGAQPLDLR